MANCSHCGSGRPGRPPIKESEWYCSQPCLDASIAERKLRRRTHPDEPTALYESVCFACNRVPEGQGSMRLTQAQYRLMASLHRRCQQPYCGGALMLDPLDTVRHMSASARLAELPQ